MVVHGCFDRDGLTPLGIASLKVYKDSVSSETPWGYLTL
jgi:hypothetical protein